MTVALPIIKYLNWDSHKSQTVGEGQKQVSSDKGERQIFKNKANVSDFVSGHTKESKKLSVFHALFQSTFHIRSHKLSFVLNKVGVFVRFFFKKPAFGDKK